MMLTLAIGGLGALAGARVMLARRALADRSVLFLGKTRAEEKALSDLAGVPMDRFIVLGQRIMWGLLQPDLIQIDVDAV